MALYGAATEMGWRDRVTPRWVLSGVVTSSLAPELSTGMHIAGGMREGIGSSYSGTVLLPERRRSQLMRDLPDGPQVCRSTRTSRPISLAKEVPPRRERDLILLPHVLSYPGTPR